MSVGRWWKSQDPTTITWLGDLASPVDVQGLKRSRSPRVFLHTPPRSHGRWLIRVLHERDHWLVLSYLSMSCAFFFLWNLFSTKWKKNPSHIELETLNSVITSSSPVILRLSVRQLIWHNSPLSLILSQVNSFASLKVPHSTLQLEECHCNILRHLRIL